MVELALVITIIAILSAVTFSVLPMLLKANQLDSSVNTLTGILEEARETAISANAYVWVAFTDAPANSPMGTWIAVMQSEDGTESPINTTVTVSWATTGITVPGGNLQLVNKLQNLPAVKIVDASKLASGVTSQAPSASATTLFEPSGMQWTVTPLQNTGAGSGIYFTHALEFTPNGEAHSGSSAWANNIQFGLVPTTGSTVNSALFNVSRLTGKTTVYRQ